MKVASSACRGEWGFASMARAVLGPFLGKILEITSGNCPGSKMGSRAVGTSCQESRAPSCPPGDGCQSPGTDRLPQELSARCLSRGHPRVPCSWPPAPHPWDQPHWGQGFAGMGRGPGRAGGAVWQSTASALGPFLQQDQMLSAALRGFFHLVHFRD